MTGTPIITEGETYYLRRNKNTYTLFRWLPQAEDTIILAFNYNKTIILRNLVKVKDRYYLYNANNEILEYDNGYLAPLDLRGRICKSDGQLMIFDENHIVQYSPENKTIDTLRTIGQASDDLSIRNIKKDKAGNIILTYSSLEWFRDSVYVMEAGTEHIIDYHGISNFNNKFQDFHTDDYRFQWLLVGHNGLHTLRFNRDGVQRILPREGVPKGEFGNIIPSVVEDKRGRLYFSVEGRNIYAMDKDGSEPELLPASIQKYFKNNQIMDYSTEGDFICSFSYDVKGKNGSYNYLDLKKTYVRKFPMPIKLRDLYIQDTEHVVLSGFNTKTKNGYILRHSIKTSDIDTLFSYAEPIIHISKPSAQGNRVITTADNTLLVDADYTVIADFNETNKTTALNTPRVPIFYNDKILLGSFNGIYVLNNETLKVEKHFSELNGLTNNKTMCIIADRKDNIWITSYNGITILDKNFTIIRRLYENDGLINREFNTKAGLIASNGKMLLGSINGLQIMDVDKILNWRPQYGLSIKSIEAYDGQSHSILPNNDVIEILENIDSVIVNLETPDYIAFPNQLKDFNIHGKNVDIDIDSEKNKLILTNFSRDSFSLHSSNHMSRPITMKFQVVKDYKTLYNVLKYSFLISLLAILISALVIVYDRKREEEKTKYNKRIAQLQMTALQAQMNPHFIFNSLGAIQYFIQTHDTEKADEYLSNFAKLMRMILESSKSNTVRVSEEIELLKLFISLVDIRFEGKFDTEWYIDDELYHDDQIPPMIIQPFIENAINHGLIHLQDRKGKLQINVLCPTDKSIRFEVIDNGVGRKKAGELRSSTHIPRGMQIVNERIELSNTKLHNNVTTEIIDLYDNDNNPCGTKAVIDFNISTASA